MKETPSKLCFHVETVCHVCEFTTNSSCHVHQQAVCQGKPGTLTSTISHQETHQLKGQYFVGSWIIYNLLKVSSNCEANNETMFKEYQRMSQCRYQRYIARCSHFYQYLHWVFCGLFYLILILSRDDDVCRQHNKEIEHYQLQHRAH